jgi:hypothetical protein
MHAANIIWVSGGHDYDTDGVSDDFMWIDLLEAEGYTVDYRTGNWTTLDDSKIAEMNAADLVIIARCTSSGDYTTDATEINQWDSITTPMLLNSTHLARNSRAKWLNTGSTNNATPTMQVVDTGHPIFAGITLDADNQVEMLAGPDSSFASITNAGNGTVLATRADNNQVWIAEWEPGVEYYEGAGQVPAGPRMFMVAGTQEVAGVANFGELNLTEEGIRIFLNAVYYMIGGPRVKASSPDPYDGALYSDTWISLGWSPGDFAASHDVYLGESFDDVNDATRDSELFRGNQTELFFSAGYAGNPYPEGLVPGTTYYWRIDEVNEAEPNSPWKGDVWSFSIPSKTAYNPVPADDAENVDLNVRLSWTTGIDAKIHYIYFGEDFDEVNNDTTGIRVGTANYTPGPLKLAKTYYWRVDESDGTEINKGEVWSLTTLGAVGGPNPSNGAVGVSPTSILTWNAGAVAASHEVYFGSDADAVKNATKASTEYKGPRALGDESYDPGKLMLETTYYWRIDEVNGVNPDSPWTGNVWSFTTSGFFVLDDFEIYDANDNQIWYSWHDGLGYGMQGAPPFFAGNGTGAAVGDEATASYTEETIVNGGLQSMPLTYDNNKQGYARYSEVERTLSDIRDWTAEGVAELSLWFRGNPASVGSFVEGPVGTYTMTASGTDIFNVADEFHFAYKTLTGVGTIEARVLSVEQTDVWANAGVMIRETLEPGSKFAAVIMTSTNANGTPTQGCRFRARTDTDGSATSDTSIATAEQMAITVPYWVKIERDVTGNLRGYYSADGTNWQLMVWRPGVSMASSVYIGLSVTAHNASAVCEAVFSDVRTTGNVSGQWASQDIGITSNAAELLYVAVSNSAGNPAVVVHNDLAAAQIDTWTEWVIPLQAFVDQGINLTNVDRIAIGLGTKGNMTIPGGSGKMYFDDIRLYRPKEAAAE